MNEPMHMPEGVAQTHPKRMSALLILASIALVALALALYFSGGTNNGAVDRENDELEVVPPPSAEDIATNSIFPKDLQIEFELIQEKLNRGEMTFEEADRRMQELYSRVPVPPPPPLE